MKMITAVVIVIVVVVGAIALRPRIARADLLKEGQIAPPFSTQMITGDQQSPVSLSDFHGRKVILYFYPKDQTPGCTKEACAFRDGYSRFTNAGLTVLGCSVDSADAHKAFIQKYNLPFPLLLDPDKKIATEYGAANGIPILGLDRRNNYVIDEKGQRAQGLSQRRSVNPRDPNPGTTSAPPMRPLQLPASPASAPSASN